MYLWMFRTTLKLAYKTYATVIPLWLTFACATPLLNTHGSVLMLVDSLWTGEPQNCAVSISGRDFQLCSLFISSKLQIRDFFFFPEEDSHLKVDVIFKKSALFWAYSRMLGYCITEGFQYISEDLKSCTFHLVALHCILMENILDSKYCFINISKEKPAL